MLYSELNTILLSKIRSNFFIQKIRFWIGKKYVLLILSILSNIKLFAQDPQFSQFYLNPVYHNPVFAGNTGGTRIISNFREQWFKLSGTAFRSYAVSVDTYLSERVGLGIHILSDQQSNNINITSASIQYSCRFGLTATSNLYLGGQVSGYSVNVVADNLTFVDQFTSNGGVTSASMDPLAVSNVSIGKNDQDVSAGFTYESYKDAYKVNTPSFSVGMAIHHIAKSVSKHDLMDTKIGIHGGIKLPFNKKLWEIYDTDESMWEYSFYLRNQSKNWQFDTGLNLRYEPIMMGIWYRGTPMRKYKKQSIQQDAIILMASYEGFERLKFGLSYDIPIYSALRSASMGSYEINIWWGFGRVNFKGTKPGGRNSTGCKNPKIYYPW